MFSWDSGIYMESIIGIVIILVAVVVGLKFFVLPPSFHDIEHAREQYLKHMIKHEHDILPDEDHSGTEKDTDVS